jgi:hypothetical protein
MIIGFSGWLSGRDAKKENNGEFKGTVLTKLETIIQSTEKNEAAHKEMYARLGDHETRLYSVEQKVYTPTLKRIKK